MAKVKGKRGREGNFLLVSLDQTSYPECTAFLQYPNKNNTAKGTKLDFLEYRRYM